MGARPWGWLYWHLHGDALAIISFLFAALQAVPRSVIEAAAIDGAHFWHRFFTIVLPLISPTTFFLLVVNVVYAFFETFGVIHSIEPLVGHNNSRPSLYIRFFFLTVLLAVDLGSSSAQSVILLVLVGLLTVFQFKYIEKRVALLMKQNSDGMVSNRGWGLWLTHAVMIVGVLIVFFPLWLAFAQQ